MTPDHLHPARNAQGSFTVTEVEAYLEKRPQAKRFHDQIVNTALQTKGPIAFLDLGCGSGKDGLYILQNLVNNGKEIDRVTVVDMMSENIAEAREVYSQAGLRCRSIVGGLPGDYPVGETYNLVNAGDLIHWMSPDCVFMLVDDVYRSLEPGGVFSVSSCTPYNNARVGSGLTHLLFTNYDDYSLTGFPDISVAYGYSLSCGMTPMSFWTEESLSKLAETVGFRVVSTVNMPNIHFPILSTLNDEDRSKLPADATENIGQIWVKPL